MPEHTSALKVGLSRPWCLFVHGQRRAPQKRLKVKDQGESERRRCVSLHRSVPIRRRRPSVPIRGSNLPRASAIGAHISPLSLQTTAVSPDLQKHAPLQERISQEAALSPPPPAHHRRRLKGGVGGGAGCLQRRLSLSRQSPFVWLPSGFPRAVCVFSRCSINCFLVFSFVWIGVVAPKPSPH